jgi:hypothetical protein
MSLSKLPPPIQTVLRAVQAGDCAALRAALEENAVLTEEGLDYRGDGIAGWLDGLVLRGAETVRPINEARHGGETVLTILTTERDPNGRYVACERNWHFTIKGDRVLAVRILPRVPPALPPAVAAYVRATNNSDLEGLLATFADDAFVNDELRDHWGKQAIREWAARDIIGRGFTMYVLDVIEHYGQVIVTANVNGNFEWRGLPDPFVLAFHFCSSTGRIVQLIILPKQLDV